MKYPLLIFPDGPLTVEDLKEAFDALQHGYTYVDWTEEMKNESLLVWEEVMKRVDMLRGIEQETGITYNHTERLDFMLNHNDGSIDLEPQQVVKYLGTCIAECARRANKLAELRDALEEELEGTDYGRPVGSAQDLTDEERARLSIDKNKCESIIGNIQALRADEQDYLMEELEAIGIVVEDPRFQEIARKVDNLHQEFAEATRGLTKLKDDEGERSEDDEGNDGEEG